ncbi:MAG: metalloregulator ArsR/SmtB family transcription factor [Clostridium sp.]|nr:metalloregulator ArsR/SmtB family transcription factor [Clostridium sp.]
MDDKYEVNARILKALGDVNRLKIIKLLSCGEKCACEILKSFNFTQPTLSHHMKILMECGLVKVRKNGTWNLYKLNIKNSNKLILFLLQIITESEECECNNEHSDCTEDDEIQ